MSTKALICRCEDVTLADLQHTISLGYKTIEEVKRYTGLGTGPCEGKECMVHCARMCVIANGGDEAAVQPFTSRPPVQPAPLGIFARGAEGSDE
jgi:bacterioferritin-associated ferredoxin